MVWVCATYLILTLIANCVLSPARESRAGGFLLKSHLLPPPPSHPGGSSSSRISEKLVFRLLFFFSLLDTYPSPTYPPISPAAVHFPTSPLPFHPTTSKNANNPPLLRLHLAQARAHQQHPCGAPLRAAPATATTTARRGANAHGHAHERRAQEEQVRAGQKGAQDHRQPDQDAARREGQAQRGRDRRAQGEREECAGLFGDGEGLLREELLVVLRLLLLLLRRSDWARSMR